MRIGISSTKVSCESPEAANPTKLQVASLLSLIAGQAVEADATRSVSPAVIAGLKSNDVMRMSAVRDLGGLESSVTAIGRELEAVAPACGSTGWCLWNHLCVFHFYCGLLGPAHIGLLRSITANRHWVCLPAGAGTGVIGRAGGEEVVLNGVASFGSGARYADYAGVTFVFEGERAPHLALVRTDQKGVRIDPTWKAMSLRASATDHVYYRKCECLWLRLCRSPCLTVLFSVILPIRSSITAIAKIGLPSRTCGLAAWLSASPAPRSMMRAAASRVVSLSWALRWWSDPQSM